MTTTRTPQRAARSTGGAGRSPARAARPAREARWAAALALALLAGCSKGQQAPLIDKLGVEVRGVDWQPAEARKRFKEELFRPGGFKPVPEGAVAQKGKGTWNLALAVEVPEAPKGEERGEAFALARLSVEGSDGQEHEVLAMAKEAVGGPGLDEWREAARGAASSAMKQAADGAKALVAAVGKKDSELVVQLKSDDALAREWAAAVLAERKNPAALETMTQLLDTDDLMRARWTMRYLIRLGDPRAAAPLIEASRHRDDTFQREIVFALGELGGEESEAYLFTVAEGHDLPLMRQSAERALAELRARRAKDGGTTP